MVTKAPRFSRSTPFLKQLHWLPVKFRIHFKICTITFQTLKDNQPAHLADLFVRSAQNIYAPQIQRDLLFLIIKTGPRAFSISGPALWNAETMLTFRKLLKAHLFDLVFSHPSFLAAPCWTNLLWSRLCHMLTLRICAPLSSVR